MDSVRIDVSALRILLGALKARGYEVIAPTLREGAICYAPVTAVADLPAGWTATQEPGKYRLERRSDDALFSYAVGPKSLKDFLYPSELKLLRAEKTQGPFRILAEVEPAPRRAFIGVRACELAAAGVQDRVLMQDHFHDPAYEARRKSSFIVAVHCAEPAGTCFCTSWDTGPRAKGGFDLALTEFVGEGRHEFLVEIGSAAGAEVMDALPSTPATADLRKESQAVTAEAVRNMPRRLDVVGLRERLRDNFDDAGWDAVAERCLACGNCTQVCPTCFCTNVEDTNGLTGQTAERSRRWDSCFSLEMSYIHGGSVRKSTKSRYRQWLTHKLSYWHDQFGTSGCVGCGRCITWCPVGIDITREAAVIGANGMGANKS
jgi:ferredoxin